MTQGPPPAAAGSSRSTPNPCGSDANPFHSPAYNPYSAAYSTGSGTQMSSSQASQNNWVSNWQQYYQQNAAGYSYPQGYSQAQQNYGQHSSYYQGHKGIPQAPASLFDQSLSIPTGPRRQPVDAAIQTQDPPQDSFDHWDAVFRTFLVEAKLTETLKAFELDMMVLSPDWEATGVYAAIGKLVGRLQELSKHKDEVRKGKMIEGEDTERVNGDAGKGLDERKLSYVQTRLAPGETPRTPSTMIKSISHFLARNRARNNASNRTEFLYSLNERKKQSVAADISSCARTDSRPIDRDAQMKYDIAKNSDGPLSRTRAKRAADTDVHGNADERRVRPRLDIDVKEEDEEGIPSRYPALDERLKNIETHFGVRYVPSPPRTLLARVGFLEEHIIKLEKEYPPWAALWFNQPGRGWPPPPRTTPIIVPSNLRYIQPSTVTPPTGSVPASSPTLTSSAPTPFKEEESNDSFTTARGKGKAKGTQKQSSLHRAVMEKLEVQKALEDYRSGT